MAWPCGAAALAEGADRMDLQRSGEGLVEASSIRWDRGHFFIKKSSGLQEDSTEVKIV